MRPSSNMSCKNNSVLFRSWQNPHTLPLVFTLTETGEIACHDPNNNDQPDRVYDADQLFLHCVMECEQLKNQPPEVDRTMAQFSDSHMSDLMDLMDYIIKPALMNKRMAERTALSSASWVNLIK